MSGSAAPYPTGNGRNADLVGAGIRAADYSRDCGYERVLSSIEEAIAEFSVSPQQHALLQTAVSGLKRGVLSTAESGDCIPSIDLPLGVYAAITGSDEAAVSLAAACALVCLSVKLFDDLADGDRQSHWAGYSAGEVNLAAATMLSTLPQLILTRLDLAPLRRLRMQEILAEGLLRISAGQQVDLALTGTREASVAEVEAAVIGKTGERFATYCRLAAEMAGAAPQAMAEWAAFGREIGVAANSSVIATSFSSIPNAATLRMGRGRCRSWPAPAGFPAPIGRAFSIFSIARARTGARSSRCARSCAKPARSVESSSGPGSTTLGRAQSWIVSAQASQDSIACCASPALAPERSQPQPLFTEKPTLDIASIKVGPDKRQKTGERHV